MPNVTQGHQPSRWPASIAATENTQPAQPTPHTLNASVLNARATIQRSTVLTRDIREA